LSQYCLSVCPHIAHNIAAYPGGRIRTPDKPALHCLDNETPLHRSIRQNPISSPTPSQILHFPIVYPTYTLHTPTGYCSSVKTTVFHGTSPSDEYRHASAIRRIHVAAGMRGILAMAAERGMPSCSGSRNKGRKHTCTANVC
jgi:hypothetical protein